MTDDERHGISRREAIAGAAAAAGAGVGVVLLLRGGSDDDGATSTVSTGQSVAASPNCVLTPEQTEGPYYIDDGLIRSDITEGKDGTPLELRLQVLNAAECSPIKDATVEVWHCDALGNYSGFSEPTSEKTYLRGGQRSDASGNVTFKTIYPGWYSGRTTHIHIKVHAGGQEVHTGQLYFPDTLNAAVYEKQSPYDSRGQKDVPNAQDSIFNSGGAESTLRLTKQGSGYVGRLALGVRT